MPSYIQDVKETHWDNLGTAPWTNASDAKRTPAGRKPSQRNTAVNSRVAKAKGVV